MLHSELSNFPAETSELIHSLSSNFSRSPPNYTEVAFPLSLQFGQNNINRVFTKNIFRYENKGFSNDARLHITKQSNK